MIHMKDFLLEHVMRSIVFWVFGLGAVCISMVVFAQMLLGGFPTVSSTAWQAVFLTNNQVYFGKLTDDTVSYVSLTDVYYLRTASDLTQNGAASLNLIKLGGELHGPEDVMHIPKSNILFWENMKPTSQVVETILAAHR